MALLIISRYRDIILLDGDDIIPTLSKFYGIIIRMYFRTSEHNPPHIYAIYNEDVAILDIKTGKIIEGHLPNKAVIMVKEWIKL